MLAIILLLLTTPLFAQDTYCFRVDISSFSQKELDNFKTMGSINDPDIFRQTYLLDNTSYYKTLKITPKDDKELQQLLALNGLDILGVYSLNGGQLQVKQDNSQSLSNVKPTPALPPKPDVKP